MNAIDLLNRRMTLGAKLVGYRQWVGSMRGMVDPATKLPIVTDPIVRMRADGTSDTTVPAGYALEHFAGQTVAVHKGYDGLFHNLTDSSWFSRGTVKPMLMKYATLSKHIQLVFDSYHLGRLAFWNAMVRGAGDGTFGSFLPGNPMSFKRGVTLLDNTFADLREMERNGEIEKGWLKDLEKNKRDLNTLVDMGYNVGRIQDNIHNEWIKNLPLAGRANHFIFDQFQRGAMSEAGLIELNRQRRMQAGSGKSDSDIAREVAKDLNVRFGNLNSQSWIKSRTGQDLARTIFLAPQWNESLLKAEFGAAKQLGMAPIQTIQRGRLNIGPLGRAAAVAVTGQFIANQIINFVTRGQPTWENKEEGFGAKVSAWIPDMIGNGPGFFLNPFTLPAELSHLFMKSASQSGDVTKAAKQLLASRLSSGARGLIYTPLVREDEMGAKLRNAREVGGQMAKTLVPSPISGGAVARAGKQLITGRPEEKYPGQFERQVFQSAGVKLDSAPSNERRMSALASQFNKSKGIVPNAEYFHGDYYNLDNALKIGNEHEIKSEIQDLLQKKTAAQISVHYNTWANAPFTGSRTRENEFLGTLSAEQRQTYDAARAERRRIAAKAVSMVQ
jgi:hypothetical protein